MTVTDDTSRAPAAADREVAVGTAATRAAPTR